MNQTIKAVIFDLGRVLIDVDFHQGLFRLYDSNRELDSLALLNQMMQDPVFKKFSTGQVGPDEVYHNIRNRFNLPLTYNEFTDQWCQVFQPIEGMENLFWEVAESCRVGLLSDTDILHWEYTLDHYPFLKFVKNPTLSFIIGAVKPDPLCYHQAARDVGYPVELCLFIDDKIVNVKGALKAGMDSVQFNGVQSLRKELKRRGILS